MDCDKQMNDPVDKYLEPQLMNDYFKHMLKQLGSLSRPTLLQPLGLLMMSLWSVMRCYASGLGILGIGRPL